MRTHEFILRIRLTRGTARGLLSAALLLGPAALLNPGQNTLKWTTYIPSPNGAFVNLTSNNAAQLSSADGDVYLGGDQGCGFTPSPTAGTRYTETPLINCTKDVEYNPRVVRILNNVLINEQGQSGGTEPKKIGKRYYPILHIRGNIWVNRLFWSDVDLDSNFTVDKCPNLDNCVITKNTTLTINWSITEAIISGKPYPVKDPKTGETKIYKDYFPRFVTRIGHTTGSNLYVDLNPTWKILQPDGGSPVLPPPPPTMINGTTGKNLGDITGQCTYSVTAGTDLKGTCTLAFPKANNYTLGIELCDLGKPCS